MVTSVIVTWYLVGYQRPAHIPAAPSIRAVWTTTLQSLSLTISPSRWGYWVAAGFAVVLLTVATTVRLAVVAWRTPVERPRALGLCAMTLAFLSVATAVGFSRSGVGHGAGLAGRYITIMSPLICALTWHGWSMVLQPRGLRFTSPCSSSCVRVFPHSYGRAESGRARRAVYDRIERGLKNGVPTERLVDIACPDLFSQRDIVYESFQMLKKAGIGKFRYMVDDGLAARDDGSRAVR